MKKIIALVFGLCLLFSGAHAESISNDLLSSTVGFWTPGTPAPTNGAPEATPTDYSDADYVVVPSGTGNFTWQTSDGTDGEGVVTMWIYDIAANVENADLGYPPWAPQFGIRNSAGGDMVLGVRRAVFSSYNQAYNVHTNTDKFLGSWFIDGLRGHGGVPFVAGWYKFGFLAKLESVQIEAYDVDYLNSDVLTHGTASRIYDVGITAFAQVVPGNGWSGLSFKGDQTGGPEDIHVAVAGGSGVYAGVGDGSVPIAPKNISSWGAVKALYK